jgi:hypothetical protein
MKLENLLTGFLIMIITAVVHAESMPPRTVVVISYGRDWDPVVKDTNFAKLFKDCDPPLVFRYIDNPTRETLNKTLEGDVPVAGSLFVINAHGREEQEFGNKTYYVGPKFGKGVPILDLTTTIKKKTKDSKSWLLACSGDAAPRSITQEIGVSSHADETAQGVAGFEKVAKMYCSARGANHCKLFNDYDKDHDGIVTAKELRSYLRQADTAQAVEKVVALTREQLETRKVKLQESCERRHGKFFGSPVRVGSDLSFRLIGRDSRNSPAQDGTFPPKPLYQNNHALYVQHQIGDYLAAVRVRKLTLPEIDSGIIAPLLEGKTSVPIQLPFDFQLALRKTGNLKNFIHVLERVVNDIANRNDTLTFYCTSPEERAKFLKKIYPNFPGDCTTPRQIDPKDLDAVDGHRESDNDNEEGRPAHNVKIYFPPAGLVTADQTKRSSERLHAGDPALTRTCYIANLSSYLDELKRFPQTSHSSCALTDKYFSADYICEWEEDGIPVARNTGSKVTSPLFQHPEPRNFTLESQYCRAQWESTTSHATGMGAASHSP